MESDTLDEIITKSQMNNVQENDSTSNLVNEITSFNKPLSINNDFYNVDDEDLEFILNQEYEFNPDNKESKDCDDDLFQIEDIPEDTNSEIIPLELDLAEKNLKKNELILEDESNLDNDASFSENTNSTEAINEIINDLIEKVDQKSPVINKSTQLPTAGNVSRITIHKIEDIEPTNEVTNQDSDETANTFESIISNLKSSKEKKSINLVDSLEVVKRSKPNILRKNRHSMPSNSKFKSMHISEILKIYGGAAPKPEKNQPIVQNKMSPAIKTRIRQKTSIVVTKNTHVELIREYLDSNNNVVRQEKIEEKDHKDVLQNLNNDKILPNKSTKLLSIDELSSSSSINLNELLENKKNKKNDSAKKSYKLALSNRYRNKSPDTTKQVKKRPVRAKRKLSQKPEFKSQQKVNNFSFSNLRFNLTPKERKKDLLELKSGIESEKETSSPSKESLNEDTIVNKKIGNFLLEFGNEMQQMVVEDCRKKLKNCYVPIPRVSDSDFEYYTEKYRNEKKKPKANFKLGDKVFVLVDDLFLPALVKDIRSMRKTHSSSFFDTSSSDIYYSYGCNLAFKSQQFEPSDHVVYQKETLIIRHDWIKPKDTVLAFNLRDSRFASSSLIGLTTHINKNTHLNDFIVKRFRSRYKKSIPFQLIGLSQDEGEKILKRILNEKIKTNIGKSPSKRFSYVNKVFDPIYTESESDFSPKKRKSDDDYIDEPEIVLSEDNENVIELRNKKKKKNLVTKRRRYNLKTEDANTDKNSDQLELSKSGEDEQIELSSNNASNTSLHSSDSLNLTVCRAASLTNTENQRNKRTMAFAKN